MKQGESKEQMLSQKYYKEDKEINDKIKSLDKKPLNQFRPVCQPSQPNNCVYDISMEDVFLLKKRSSQCKNMFACDQYFTANNQQPIPSPSFIAFDKLSKKQALILRQSIKKQVEKEKKYELPKRPQQKNRSQNMKMTTISPKEAQILIEKSQKYGFQENLQEIQEISEQESKE